MTACREMTDLPLRDQRPRARHRAQQSRVARAAAPANDAHAHLGRWLTGGRWAVPDVPAPVEPLDSCNVTAMVNPDGRWGNELEANLDRYDRAHPGRSATICHVDWAALTRSNAGVRLAAILDRSVRAGARGLKVREVLGVHVRHAADRLVLPDDGRPDPLWHQAAALNVPVAVHTVDPVAFFDPVDRYDERLEELLTHLTGRTPTRRFLGSPGRSRHWLAATRTPRSSECTPATTRMTSAGSTGCSARTQLPHRHRRAATCARVVPGLPATGRAV